MLNPNLRVNIGILVNGRRLYARCQCSVLEAYRVDSVAWYVITCIVIFGMLFFHFQSCSSSFSLQPFPCPIYHGFCFLDKALLRQ